MSIEKSYYMDIILQYMLNIIGLYFLTKCKRAAHLSSATMVLMFPLQLSKA